MKCVQQCLVVLALDFSDALATGLMSKIYIRVTRRLHYVDRSNSTLIELCMAVGVTPDDDADKIAGESAGVTLFISIDVSVALATSFTKSKTLEARWLTKHVSLPALILLFVGIGTSCTCYSTICW